MANPQHSPPNSFRQQAVYDLCRRLFATPSRLTDVFSHPVRDAVLFQPHTHRHFLQFCLMDRCTGSVTLANDTIRIHETTAMLAYPRQSHGYELHPMDSSASVHVLKLRVETTCPFSRQRVYPSLTTGLRTSSGLREAFHALSRIFIVINDISPLLIARATELLCLWPQGHTNKSASRNAANSEHAPDVSAEIAAALDRFELSVGPSPNVQELAEAANLSPRHFSRRFRLELGCTPHEYITAQRLDRAKQLLLTQRLAIHEIADMLGFPSVATFSRWFHHYASQPPTTFKNDPSVH